MKKFFDKVMKYFFDNPYFDPLFCLFLFAIVGVNWSVLVLIEYREGETIIALFVLPITILISFYYLKNKLFKSNDNE
jgi:hypothetical protein